ncbi:MAG: ATP-dependent DNA helicase RecG [Anaerolineales bacterium]|nr:ATP-dependent DNA helicase RecG [Anaerolineales bacterium]
MKPSLDKLYKFFKLEIDRNYDNHAVMGGMERMLSLWEHEARADGIPEDLVQFVLGRIQDYSRLSVVSRAETLEGVWKRIQRSLGLSEALPRPGKVEPKENEPIRQTASPTPDAEVESPGPTTRQEAEMDEVASQSELAALATEPQAEQVEEILPPPAAASKPVTSIPTVVKDIDPAGVNAPVTVLKGIGPHNAQNLARLNLFTLRDLLFYLPRRYDDYSRMKPINRLVYGEDVTVIGTVQSIHMRPHRGVKDQAVEAVVTDGSGILRITWFNQPYIARRLHSGAQIVLSGKIDQYLGRLVMINPEMETLEQQQLNTNRIVPVYSLASKITQHWLRRTMNQVVMYWAPRLKDPLPEDIRRSANLMDLSTALMQLHFPDSWEALKSARQRLAFEEILLLQLGVLRQKRAWMQRSAQRFNTDPEWLQMQINRLPYHLTNAQHKAIQDIQKDLASGQPANRLLQGDVGSGKTVVAALAIAIVVQAGAQAAVMAPTSILAEQHYRSLLRLMAETTTPGEPESLPAQENDEEPEGELPESVEQPSILPPLRPEEIRLLVGATPEVEKRQIREQLASGEIKLVIGTHALLEEPVQFSNLQFIVVDEQHRFGVEQRAILRSKGDNPHLLVMTATPIPRSLALTVYGDLDLTVMDELPAGRQAIGTYVLLPRERERAYSLIRSQVEQGRQAFIIYPLVEESDKSDAKAAVDEHARLQAEYFPQFSLGLLHGQMRPEDKDLVMDGFRNRKFDILVSTTVVEVGVDVPNATVMVIEGANRFGLAQLHQLRGRVGRGAEKSFCLLIPDSADAVENERLQVMTQTNDGFVLAEKDLEQRGPGQFLGTRQAGFNELKVANLTDVHLIETARRHAIVVFERDPELDHPENQLLKAALHRAWGEPQGDIS